MRAPLLAALAALASAGCGVGGESRTVTEVLTETNVTTVVRTVTTAPALTGRSFCLPTCNIGFAFVESSRSLCCKISSGLRTETERIAS